MKKHPKDLTDTELIEECLAGVGDAWSELVHRYARLVASIPARSGLPPDLREEVFQSVWTIAVKHLGSLRDHRSLPAWLIRTTQRETWRISREAKRARGSDQQDPLTWADPEEADLLEDRQRMREALDRLDDRCRDLLLVLFRDDRPDYDQIAESMDMPRGSIGPTRGRCLDKLRTIYSVSDAPRT